jgi:hypothetical protein
MKLILFKTSDNREVENPGAEIWKLAKRLQMSVPGMTFNTARDLTMEAEPALARGWLGADEE